MPKRRFIDKDSHTEKLLLRTSNKAIINLSNHELNKHEKCVLKRGLSFCSQPSTYNNLETLRDTFIFNRRLGLAHFFQNSNQTDTDSFRRSSGWTPQAGKSANLDAFINVITTKISKFASIKQEITITAT